MASASSFHSSMALQSLLAPHTERPMLPHLRPNLIMPRHPSSRPVITFSRRCNNPNTPITSSKKKKVQQRLPQNAAAEEDDLDADAIELLFSQLEEDLKNDDKSLDDDDGEILEEDLVMLERELAEALGDDELLGAFDSLEDDEVNKAEDNDGEEEEEEEEPVKLKNWQIRRLAYALKNGRRKTSIKNLAADVCLDRAVVLQLLRDPPPSLLLMSAALPDKPISVISEPESKPLEEVSSETAADVAQPEATVNLPVHVMQKNWSARKRLKKVQVETLERVFDRTKRPTNAMISSIVHVTNLPRKKVVKWFEDKRAEHGVPDHRLPYQRDERGAWVCGYYGRLDSGTSLEAELWALYKGLTVMLQKGMHEVIIETDAKQVVQLMEDATDEKFSFKGLLEDAKIIFRGCECTINHIYKEGNLCADALAKFGAEQLEEILVVNDPPQEIQCYLVADMIGLSRERA